ncbi:MAG: glycine cleavage system protein H [Chloroflexota bacterium]|nr:glycine cleavage system protein H [Chloroflexota bacterium]
MPRIDSYWLSLELYYHSDHMWLRVENENEVTLGFDDFAQQLAGEIQYVELAHKGRTIEQEKVISSIEAGKWVGRLISPISGIVTAVNEELDFDPSLINKDPYGDGWILLVEPSNLEAELENLLQGDAAVEWLKEEMEKYAKK